MTYLGVTSAEYKTSGESSVKEDVFSLKVPWLLTLDGIVYDNIVCLSDRMLINEPDWELIVREWKTQTLSIADYPTGKDTTEVYWRTLLRA